METVKLQAKNRDLKVSVKAMRRDKKIPAIYYGKKQKSLPLQLEYQIFRKVFLNAGTSQVIDLDIEGKNTQVLVHDVQYHHLTGAITHVDFLHVNLKEEVTTHVPVEMVGISAAVKDFGGILTTVKHELTVKCLPLDIPHSIKVDISVLEQLSSSVHVKDLIVPAGVQIMDNREDVVVTVAAPRVEEEVAPTAASAIAGTAAEAAAAEDAAKAAAAAAAGAAPGGQKEGGKGAIQK